VQRSRQFGYEYSENPDINIIAIHSKDEVIATLTLSKTNIFGEYNSYWLNGIVILPEYRQKGFGTKLIKEAAFLTSADVFVGSTKNPAAVMTVVNGVLDCSMRSYYGMYEVTSEVNSGRSDLHTNYILEYLKAKGIDNPSLPLDENSVVLYKDTDVLSPDIPAIETYPQYLKEAFVPVIRAQISVGRTKTAVMPLISIDEKLLYGKTK